MDSLFSKGFKSAKCKMLVKLVVARIKLLRNKRDIQVKQLRREIANLLQAGQEPSARIRVEHIIREQNIMAAYEILDLFCELLVVRLPIIESQRQCPLDLKEAISSLIFAAPRCADLPELLEVRGLFGVKYGKEFVTAAAELRPGCGVNRRIIEKLSIHAPSGEVKLKLLKEIAAEHNLEWDPSNTEAELLNPPEDLLNGPSQFLASSEVSMSTFPKKEIRPEEEQTTAMTEEEPVKVNAGHADVPIQSATKPTPLKPSSSLSDHVDEKEQFVPFALSLPGKFPHASQTDSPSLSSSMEARTADPYSAFRTTGKMDYMAMPSSTQVPENSEGHVAEFPAGESTGVVFRSDEGQKIEYANIVSAAQAAAESAELVDEKEQFVPFLLSLPGKFPDASQTDSLSLSSSSMEARTEDPYSTFRTTGKMDYMAMPSSTQVHENSEGHVAEFPAGESTGVVFRSDEGQKIDYANIVSAAQAAAESAELAAAAARAAASLAKGQASSSAVVAKAVDPTGDNSSYGEDDADLENPCSFSNPKLGGYEDNVKTPTQKDAVSVSEKPVFDDDDDDYGGTDVLEAMSLGKSVEKQESFGGWSFNNPSGLFNEDSRGQSNSFNLSQPGLPAQYDEDMFELHSEKEPVQEEPRTDEPKLNLDFFSKKRNAYSSDDADFGFSEIDYKTKPPLNFEHLGVEEKNIVHQSFPYASKNIPFHSKYSDPSTITRSQADYTSESPPSSPRSPHVVDSHC